MNPQDIARYKQSILNAQAALKRHEFFEARQWALSASQIAPEREEPWLLLAAVSEPGESISFCSVPCPLTRRANGLRAGCNGLLPD